MLMLKNYFLITIRNLVRNKVFIMINILGMGTAIGCCIVAYLNWDFARTFDTSHIHGKSIYRVQSWFNTPDSKSRYAIVPTPLGKVVENNFSDVDVVVRYTSANSDIRIGDEVFNTAVAYADSGFFDLFTFVLKSGEPQGLHHKSQIYLSETLASKYFNSTDVQGRQITQINAGKVKEFTVGGVFEDQPLNSSFAFDALTLWENHEDAIAGADPEDWKNMSTLFIQIKDDTRVDAVTRQLQQYLEPQNRAREDFKLSSFYLENFSTLASHFYGEGWLNGEQLRWGMPPSAILGPAFMAIFLLLLACFNFTNTSLAIAGRRLKEIGIRKTMGSMRMQLIFQFLNESLILCFFGLIAGVLIAFTLVPAYNSLWPGVKLSMDLSGNVAFYGFLTGILVLTGILAGTYPAFYISSFKAASILKGKMKLAGTNWFTRMLLTLQFSIALVCIISAIAFIRNASFQRDYDLGYAKNGVVTAPIANEQEFNTFRDVLALNKDIDVIAGSRNHVSDRYDKGTVKYQSDEHQVEVIGVGDDYLNAMNITIRDGRSFQRSSKIDQQESILVSEEFVKQYGWNDGAVGKRVLWQDSIQLFVVGVVKNIHTDGYWKPVAPVMFRYVGPDQYTQLVARTSPDKVATVNDFMKEAWKKISPNTVYNGRITDGNINTSEMINKNTVSIFGFLGIIAMLMSATGLYALTSLNIARKTKEIGVRKMLGASAGNIARVINFEFFVVLVVAVVIGGGLGYAASDKMMDAIWEYYLRSGAITIAIAAISMFGVAAITVAYKTIITAFVNPIHALRED